MEVCMKTWQLQEAKSRLSEVIDLAVSGSPQLITKRGEPAVYVVSVETFRKETSSWKTTLLSRPHKDIEIDVSRDRRLPREIDL